MKYLNKGNFIFEDDKRVAVATSEFKALELCNLMNFADGQGYPQKGGWAVTDMGKALLEEISPHWLAKEVPEDNDNRDDFGEPVDDS